MATTQFTIYSSSDPQGPGPLNGITGSLVTILDYCLGAGYGTGSYFKSGSNWIKPIANVSGALACYKQPSGSGMTLFVNDAGPVVGTVGQEAWAVGWELLSSLTGSNLPTSSMLSGSVGAGWGQFPTPAQQLTTGHSVWRKSITATTAQRPWIIAADSQTFYMWVLSEAAGTAYAHFGFGDIYSFRGTSDLYRCFIYGKTVETSAPSINNDATDCICAGSTATINTLNAGLVGHYMARNSGGTGGSTLIGRKGDASVAPAGIAAYVPSAGVIQCPNGSDNSLYMSPLWVVEPAGILLRGRFRGLYQICHPVANFADGQIIQGSGDFAGKTFMVIRQSIGGSYWALETSATVDVN